MGLCRLWKWRGQKMTEKEMDEIFKLLRLAIKKMNEEE